ncbi:MAG: hypothetical protein ACREN3_15350, partial [Gemmatimonadaceae bacterium]
IGAGVPADDSDLAPAHRRFRRRDLLAFAGVAAAACLIGYLGHGLVQPRPGAVDVAVPLQPASMIVPAANVAADTRPLTWQFVFQSRDARRVSLIGDFNGWNPKAAPLARAPGSGLWSVTVPLAPGRHAYAFMVNDTSIVLDPRAPVARDPDLGSRESVVLVGRP